MKRASANNTKHRTMPGGNSQFRERVRQTREFINATGATQKDELRAFMELFFPRMNETKKEQFISRASRAGKNQ